jgi:hypothetical protein
LVEQLACDFVRQYRSGRAEKDRRHHRHHQAVTLHVRFDFL